MQDLGTYLCLHAGGEVLGGVKTLLSLRIVTSAMHE
jgi:hypothetical protein